MKREDHQAATQRLLGMVSPEHQADATEILTTLFEDNEDSNATIATLTSTNATLTENNEKLRKVNADLFLKVGTHVEPTKSEPGKDTAPTLKYEDLFNEKGELK